MFIQNQMFDKALHFISRDVDKVNSSLVSSTKTHISLTSNQAQTHLNIGLEIDSKPEIRLTPKVDTAGTRVIKDMKSIAQNTRKRILEQR